MCVLLHHITLNMDSLINKGVIVIAFPQDLRDAFQLETYLTEQKEYINSTVDTVFVMGAFGALGNPSSFHHPQIRQLRLSIFNFAKLYFATHFPTYYIECLPDRFCIRLPKTSLSAESWHRDISNVNKTITAGHADDLIFGGWVNLDKEQTQYFSCVPYTHNERTTEGGFSLIKTEDRKHYKERRERIAIPPNHMLIFNEKTVHEVCSSKQTCKSYRLFMKYRLTKIAEPLFPDNVKIAQEQGVFPLSIAQTPPIYAKLHAVNWKSRLENFSENIKTEFIDGSCSHTRVKRFMPSLKEANYEMFPDYLDEELDILTPKLLLN